MSNRSTDYEPILELLDQGHGPAFIIEKLGLTMGKRQVQRIGQKYGKRTHEYQPSGRLDSDGFGSGPFFQIVYHGLVNIRGLDPHLCAQCGTRSAKRMDIHHTKYDGATIYDLEFVCRRCNTSPMNRGLQ